MLRNFFRSLLKTTIDFPLIFVNLVVDLDSVILVTVALSRSFPVAFDTGKCDGIEVEDDFSLFLEFVSFFDNEISVRVGFFSFTSSVKYTKLKKTFCFLLEFKVLSN